MRECSTSARRLACGDTGKPLCFEREAIQAMFGSRNADLRPPLGETGEARTNVRFRERHHVPGMTGKGAKQTFASDPLRAVWRCAESGALIQGDGGVNV